MLLIFFLTKRSAELYTLTMDSCEEWMQDPRAKCLYWGLILLVLLIVFYNLRNHELFQANAMNSIGILEGCAHGQCTKRDETNVLTANARFGEATVVREGTLGNEEPFTGILEGCAHGQCVDQNATNTLFSKSSLGQGTVVSLDPRSEPFKLPPGSEGFKSKKSGKLQHGISGPSREALLDVENFIKAGVTPESGALMAALGGGSAENVW